MGYQIKGEHDMTAISIFPTPLLLFKKKMLIKTIAV